MGTSYKFQIQARSGGDFYLNFVSSNLPSLSDFTIGWKHDGVVRLMISGDSRGFFRDLAINWMSSNINLLGNLKLTQLCIPGSNDAGMSKRTDSNGLVPDGMVLTQSLGIYDQLVAGSRYFDIRPVIASGQFKTGHYGKQPVVRYVGANGQTIAEIIDDINKFTAANPELIILDLSHDMNTDSGYGSLTQSEWDGLLAQLQSLNCLFSTNASDLTGLTLGDYLGNNKAAVVVIVRASVSLGDKENKGFFAGDRFPVYEGGVDGSTSYSDTDDYGTMASGQIGKLNARNQNSPNELFLLSWTLTQQGVSLTSIISMAKDANDNILNDPFSSPVLSACMRGHVPNILLLDNIDSRVAMAAMAINLKGL